MRRWQKGPTPYRQTNPLTNCQPSRYRLLHWHRKRLPLLLLPHRKTLSFLFLRNRLKSTEVLIVRAAATIRNGPSTSAKKIGTATAGAQLEVKGREKEWVQFVDPSSGNTGWIQSSLLIPPTGNEVGNLTLPTPVDTPPVKPTTPKLAKKKPSATAQVTQRPRTYADLPPDEEFLPLPRRRGPGILSRRRMLRDGLMSPGFLPPE